MEPIQPTSSSIPPIRPNQVAATPTKNIAGEAHGTVQPTSTGDATAASASGAIAAGSNANVAQGTGAIAVGASANSASASGAMSSISSSETLTATSMSQRVEAFLGSVDPELSNNAYLKLLIAALIMQVLLGEDGGAQKSNSAMQGLEALTGGRNSAMFIAIESSTNTVQLSQQSSRLDVTSAVQTLSESGTTTEGTGRQMDVTG